MAIVDKVRVEWSGSGVVGPGVSTFYFAEPATGYVAALKAFFLAVRPCFTNNTVWNIPNTGDQIDTANGDVVGTWTDGTPGTQNGQLETVGFAQGVGARIRWNTLGRTNNRRVLGSTYMVPLGLDRYGLDGLITGTAHGILQAAADALWATASADMVIVTRPNAEHAGTLNSVVSATVPAQVSWLRSRRT